MNKMAKFNVSGLWISYGLVAAFLGCVIFACLYTGASPGFFARDPLITLGGHPLMGIQSYLGILIWSVAAGVCFFCYSFLRSYQKYSRHHQRDSLFLLWSGSITLWLALDDLFQIHEYLPEIVPGLSQPIIYIVYAIILIGYILKFRKQIVHSDELGLVITALIFFGLSVFIDIVQDFWDSRWRIFFEDGFKFFGIVSWAGYLIRRSFQMLENLLKSCQQLH